MAQENAQIVREALDAYNRRDLDAMSAHWAPDAVVDWSNSYGPDARRSIAADGRSGRSCTVFSGSGEEVRIELIGEPVEVEDGLLIAEMSRI